MAPRPASSDSKKPVLPSGKEWEAEVRDRLESPGVNHVYIIAIGQPEQVNIFAVVDGKKIPMRCFLTARYNAEGDVWTLNTYGSSWSHAWDEAVNDVRPYIRKEWERISHRTWDQSDGGAGIKLYFTEVHWDSIASLGKIKAE